MVNATARKSWPYWIQWQTCPKNQWIQAILGAGSEPLKAAGSRWKAPGVILLRKWAGQHGFLFFFPLLMLRYMICIWLNSLMMSLPRCLLLGFVPVSNFTKNLGFFPSVWSFKKQLSLFFKSHESDATLGSVQQNMTGPSCWPPLGAKWILEESNSVVLYPVFLYGA